MAHALANKVAIVTGAGRGIGAATAKLFVSEGARVVLAARNAAEVENTAQGLNWEFGIGKAVAHPTDVSDEAQVTKLFERTYAEFGPADILVNCAATVEIKSFVEMGHRYLGRGDEH